MRPPKGGIQPTLAESPHKSAVDFFAATIIDSCDYRAWQCESPDWEAFSWTKARSLENTCDYGYPAGKFWMVGQCTNKECIRDSVPLPDGGNPSINLVVFFTKNFDYCYDWNCDQSAEKCLPKL